MRRLGPIRDIWPALTAATVGSALVLFDGTVVTVGLPSIQRDLGLTLAAQQWVVQAYLLAPIALLPVGGALADRFGRRAVFSAGIATFAVASALCALAPSGEALIAGRGLQGVGAGLTLPASLGLLAAAARRRRERRQVVAVWTIWTAVASASGPRPRWHDRGRTGMAVDLLAQPRRGPPGARDRAPARGREPRSRG